MEEHPQNHKSRPGCFFFVVAPFCSCPASLVCCRPRVCKVFFFCCAPGQSKKKTPPRVFFFAPAPRLFGGAGAKKKNTLGGVFFFAAAPRGRSLTHCGPGWRCLPLAGVVFFFLLRPCPDRGGVFFFCCGPGWCFFFVLAPCRLPTGLLLPLPFAGAAAKKKTPWVVFFLLRPRADAQSLTAGLGGDASRSPGRCFFFLLRPRPDRGGVFFFCCGPARTLTHSRWAGAISARPGWCFFFCCGPAGSF